MTTNTFIATILLLISSLFATSNASFNIPTHAGVSLNRSQQAGPPSVSSKRQHRQSAGYTSRSRTAFLDPASLMTTIGAFYQNQPLASAFVTCAVKGVAADLVAQKSVASNAPSPQSAAWRGGAAIPKFDLKRNVSFLLYSGIYQGMALEYIYNMLFPRLFGSNVIAKVSFSMFVLSPLLTLPLAYLFKALVFQQSISDAISQYMHDIRFEGLLKTYWMIWIPVQSIAFSVIPQHLRISFIAAFSFVWMIIFSSISSK